MPRAKSKSTDALWAEHFRAAIARKGRSPEGEGWITRKEFSRRAKMGQGSALIYLRKQVKAGKIEYFRGSAVSKSGTINPQSWYRPIP